MNVIEFGRHVKQFHTYPTLPKAGDLPALGLIGEVGELAGEVYKLIANDGGELSPERALRVLDEAGDVLWYAFALILDTGWVPERIIGAERFEDVPVTDECDPMLVARELARDAAYADHLGLTRAFFQQLGSFAAWAGWTLVQVANRNREKLVERHIPGAAPSESGTRARAWTAQNARLSPKTLAPVAYCPKSLAVTLGGIQVPGGLVRPMEYIRTPPRVEGSHAARGVLGDEGAPQGHPDDLYDADPPSGHGHGHPTYSR